MKLLKYLLIIVMVVFISPLYAQQVSSKSPSDVFRHVMQLKQQVNLLRVDAGIIEAWPDVEKPIGLEPRHVFQKSLEVLDKINRLRRIRKMGPITVPLFPTRNITPNEVYDMAERLLEEFRLFPATAEVTITPKGRVSGKSPSDVYQELWNVSLAMNPLLGVRGLKPTDVYAQSLKILEQVKFLRVSQSLPLNVSQPKITKGKRPNHSLQQAYQLLGKISQAEHNLWMKPISEYTVPRREIKPGEVYDALLIVQAEIEWIKFRLGIERDIAIPELEEQKSPDDVLFNLAWATKMMPRFSNNVALKQFPQASLKKTPNHLFGLTKHIIKELIEYRLYRGIQTAPRKIPNQSNLQAHHIYQKTLLAIEKVSEIRQQEGVGVLAIPRDHLRQITLAEVYDLIIRLDAELQVLYDRVDMPAQLAEQDHIETYSEKTASDVFQQMWKISYLLDAVRGSEGYTPREVFKQAQHVVKELLIIGRAMGRPMGNFTLPEIIHGKQSVDVLKQAQKITSMLKKLKLRMGLLEKALPISPAPDQITPDDVHNSVELILSELERIKIYLGITEVVKHQDEQSEKTPSQVLQQLQLAALLLQKFID